MNRLVTQLGCCNLLSMAGQRSRARTTRKKIMPARGPRRDLWVVVVTTSQYSKGCAASWAATRPLHAARALGHDASEDKLKHQGRASSAKLREATACRPGSACSETKTRIERDKAKDSCPHGDHRH